MPNTHTTITPTVGTNLKNLREKLGFSTREVAQRLTFHGHHVSHTTISNFERGKSIPDEALIEAFANTYKVPIENILKPKQEFEGVHYRALKEVSKTSKRQYELTALGLASTYLEIEKLINEEPLSKQKITPDLDTSSGKSASNSLREYLNISNKNVDLPIPSMIGALEAFGIYVIGLETNERIDGFAANLGSLKFIILNTNLSSDRIRLNAAHELGHHIFNDCSLSEETSEKELESRAFEFGSHFIIPDRTIKEAFKGMSMVRLVSYKEKYGISIAAMVYRAKQLNLIDDTTYTYIWKQFSKLGWRKKEPGNVKTDIPNRFETLIDIATQSKQMTLNEIARHTGSNKAYITTRLIQSLGGIQKNSSEQDETKIINYDTYETKPGG